jgi:two-component system sensor histidine kinase YesM
MNKNNINHPNGLRTRLMRVYSIVTILFIVAMYVASYVIFRTNIVSNNETVMEETTTQLSNIYNTYFEGVVNVSSNIETKLEEEDSFDEEEVSVYFELVQSMKSEIEDISLYSVAGTLVVSSSNEQSDEDKSAETWFLEAANNPLINVFSSIENENGSYLFTLSKYVAYDEHNYGILNFTLNFTTAIATLSDIDLGDGGHVVIYDKNYDTVYQSDDLTEGEIDLFQEVVFGTENISLNGHDYFLSINTIDNTTWRLAVVSNIDYIANTTSMLLLVDLIISVGFYIATIFSIRTVSNQVTEPIYKLRLAMEEISQKGYIDAKEVKVQGTYEVEDLARNYNEMIMRISTLMNQVVVEQNLKRESELSVLQNQINPHFLYNTLDSIIYEINKNENETAQNMIIALSKLFRISLSKGKSTISIRDEVEHVRNYLLIQKMRYREKFNFEIKVSEEIMDYKVTKLILQPIAENAIVHGIKNNPDGGRIEIEGSLKNGFIVFMVKDDGFGILENKIQQIYDSFHNAVETDGVGVNNVFQRIRLYYGENADIKIESELDCGTKVFIYIPVDKVQKDEN